jgi:GNAT superfamily N-acetyltransferase
VPELDPRELLAAYDEQLRDRVPERLPEGVSIERDGPLLRFVGRQRRGFIDYRDLAGLTGENLDALIARQVQVFAERGEAFEWKTRGHDQPPDLTRRLAAAGFVPESAETVLIGTVARVAEEPHPPEGVTLREVSDRSDLDRIEAMENTIWHEDDGTVADRLEAEHAVDPDALAIVVAEAAGTVVCAAWVRFEPGSDFATLWGGATLPAWRGRGVYRSVVAHRANLASMRGLRYLQVDASNDSRPILERLGFVPVTTTTPFIWSPDVVAGNG